MSRTNSIICRAAAQYLGHNDVTVRFYDADAFVITNLQTQAVLNSTDVAVITEIADQMAAALNKPTKVTPAQAKIALWKSGHLARVEELVATHPYEPVRIYFANASMWDRHHPYVEALGLDLGLTDEGMDLLFEAASRE